MSLGFDSIPVIDVSRLASSAEDRAELAVEITDICHRVGFMIVTDHGVPQEHLDAVFDMMATFFALDTDAKRSIDKLDSPWFRGWEAVGSEYTNNRPDMREQIDLWTEWPSRPKDVEPSHLRLLGPNQWPPDEVLSGMKELMSEWYRRMGALADALLSSLSSGLGLSENHLRNLFGAEPMSLTKLIHYPPTPSGEAGVNAHHDAGFLTVLAPGPTPGLQVENPDGAWIDVPAVDGGLVINLGEMLQAMTNNYLVATPHRVITNAERLSAGYFHGPSLDLRLDPLPLDPRFGEAVATSERHSRAGFMARKEETESGVGDMLSDHRASTYGEQLWNYFSRSYPANMALHHSDLAHQ
jgi:isopenicillin N synthase-like dioxygenase